MSDDDAYISGEEYEKLRHSIKTGHPKKVTVSEKTLIAAAVVIVLCVVSFFGGVAYQKHNTKSTTTAPTTTSGSTGGGFGGFGGGARRGGGAFGQVTAVSSTSVTINNERTGASSTYSITSATTISDSGQTGTISDIQTGDTVIITTSGTGSTTAKSIMVNPSFGGGQSSQNGSSSATPNDQAD